jgi:hypothetical protein
MDEHRWEDDGGAIEGPPPILMADMAKLQQSFQALFDALKTIFVPAIQAAVPVFQSLWMELNRIHNINPGAFHRDINRSWNDCPICLYWRNHEDPAKAKHSAPKRRCVTMVEKTQRCLARPVDGRHCTKHGGVAPQIAKAALKKERAKLPPELTRPVSLGPVSQEVHVPAAQGFGPYGQCQGENNEHNRCGMKAKQSGFCRYHEPVDA